MAVLTALSILIIRPIANVHAQGVVTFNQPWLDNGIAYSPLFFYSGTSFGVGSRVWPYDNMALVGAGLAGHPNNGTPHIEFVNTLGTEQYIVFSRTNGNAFGLTSVDLADPVAPSLLPVSITFNGFKGDGSTVSQTFTTAGGGISSFQTFQFNAAFASDLARVEIPSPFWAMDNIVFVPEPATASLIAIGLLALGGWRTKRCREM
jgi:hypothetical protein